MVVVTPGAFHLHFQPFARHMPTSTINSRKSTVLKTLKCSSNLNTEKLILEIPPVSKPSTSLETLAFTKALNLSDENDDIITPQVEFAEQEERESAIKTKTLILEDCRNPYL